jgi:hypothetical protein
VGHWCLAVAYLEELSEENPVGFDSHKRITVVHKHGNMEYPVLIKIQLLDAVVPE